MELIFKAEQWYMPAKFLPPLHIGDRYCFPDNEIWKISDIDIESLTNEEVKITIHWLRPLYSASEWTGRYKIGDTNWQGRSKAIEIWEKCGSSE